MVGTPCEKRMDVFCLSAVSLTWVPCMMRFPDCKSIILFCPSVCLMPCRHIRCSPNLNCYSVPTDVQNIAKQVGRRSLWL